jgi:hypothetical protein
MTYLKVRNGLFLMLWLIVAIVFVPIVVDAHVKWFTEVQPEKVPLEQIISTLFISITIAVSILLAIVTQLLPRLSRFSNLQYLDHKLDSFRKYSSSLLKYGIAMSLLIQLMTNSIFVPEFAIEHWIDMVLLWTTIICFLIPHHLVTKAGAILMFGMLINVTIEAGIFHMLDYGFYFAIVGVFLIDKTRFMAWRFPLLYLGTGLSLCWVALEKFVFPAMAMDIIKQHGVPVFGFQPEVFVVIAAFIEFVVGYLLVVGILNRLLSIVLTFIFISTTMLFGWTELIGHFPIHVILLTFIIEGVSFYKPPVQMHKTIIDQMIFVSLNFIFVLLTFLVIYYRFA